MQTADVILDKDVLIEELKFKNERLSQELAQLKRMIFGTKSERFVPDIPDEQLKLMLDNGQQVNPPPDIQFEELQYTRKKKQSSQKPTGRLPLPEYLLREEIILEPEEDTSGMKCIGQEITEELEYKPGKLYVNRYIRPKYVKPDNKGILTAGLPTRPIDKGRVGPMLLAYIITSKYTDHLPFYRQSKMFAREGYQIPTST